MLLGQGILWDLAIFLLAKDKSFLFPDLSNSLIINSFGFMNINYARKILEKTVSDYNSIADKYSRVRGEDWKEMDFLFDCLNPGNRVLDLGCGNGRFFPSFLKKEVEYLGADPSLNLVNLAKEKYPQGNFRVVSVDSLPFPDSFFDKVFSIAVLHHIPSLDLRLLFLEEIRRTLKEGGYLILTAWDLKEKMGKRGLFGWFKARNLDRGDVFLPWYGSKDTYFHCFNLEELVQLIKDSGFIVADKGEISVGQRPYSNFYIIAKKQ
jgi:ubiquinone/menaquinone biosynthesis C-methylase UbiE